MSPEKPRLDTTPNCPAPRPCFIEDAKARLPDLLSGMRNFHEGDCFNQAPPPPHKLVRASTLVKALVEDGHLEAAASHAIHQLIQEGQLAGEPIRHGCHGPSSTSWFITYDPPKVDPVFDGPVPYDELLIRSTQALWDAWNPPIEAKAKRADGTGAGAENPKRSTQEGEGVQTPAPPIALTTPPAPEMPADTPTLALLRVYTNGVSDDRIKQATQLLTDDKLTVNEKLTKIDKLIRIPSTASAEQLGEMFRVTKQAVLKTDWWIQNRKGERETEIGRRQTIHQNRAMGYESPATGEDDA